MIIKLSPRFSEEGTELIKNGDVLRINGEAFDFRGVAEGAVLPRSAIDCDLIFGDVTRVSGELIVPVVLLHPLDATNAAKYPADIISPPDGRVELPT